MKTSPEQQARLDRQETATTWYVRLQNPDLPASERIAFRRWLDSDPLHTEAFHEVEVVWQKLREPAKRLAGNGWYRPSRHALNLRWIRGPALAMACSVLAVAVAIGLWRDPGMLQRASADYASAPGEQRQLTLDDGSSVLLDSDSALDVDLSADQRTVRLLRGRAWFDVSHDPLRPFSVHSGQLVTLVLGTAFAVDATGADRLVTLTRGRVEVRDESSGEQATLAPNQQVRHHDRHFSDPITVDSTRALAWRRGLLVFDRATLGEVVDSLRRQGLPPVLLLDDSLRQQRLSGTFRTNDPQATLNALTASLQLRTTRVPGLALLIHR